MQRKKAANQHIIKDVKSPKLKANGLHTMISQAAKNQSEMR